MYSKDRWLFKNLNWWSERFVAINFNESIKEEKHLRKVVESLYIFLTTPDEVQSNSSDNCMHYYNARNLFYQELQLIDTKWLPYQWLKTN